MTYAHEQAIKALTQQANYARELAAKLDRYAKELEDDRQTGSFKITLSDRYTFAINEIENYIRNINFATLARHTAALNG